MKSFPAVLLSLAILAVLAPTAAADDFCMDSSVMGMGFSWKPMYCTMLWFDGWILDTPFKVAVGATGIFALAMFYEWVAVFAMRLGDKSREAVQGQRAEPLLPSVDARSAWGHALQSLLYAGRVCLGQMLMLVSMTYASALFLPMIAGFGMGHFLFRKRGAVVEDAEICCG